MGPWKGSMFKRESQSYKKCEEREWVPSATDKVRREGKLALEEKKKRTGPGGPKKTQTPTVDQRRKQRKNRANEFLGEKVCVGSRKGDRGQVAGENNTRT